jgi:hypothetical protein
VVGKTHLGLDELLRLADGAETGYPPPIVRLACLQERAPQCSPIAGDPPPGRQVPLSNHPSREVGRHRRFRVTAARSASESDLSAGR